jgi:hypothetical protein
VRKPGRREGLALRGTEREFQAREAQVRENISRFPFVRKKRNERKCRSAGGISAQKCEQ